MVRQKRIAEEVGVVQDPQQVVVLAVQELRSRGTCLGLGVQFRVQRDEPVPPFLYFVDYEQRQLPEMTYFIL